MAEIANGMYRIGALFPGLDNRYAKDVLTWRVQLPEGLLVFVEEVQISRGRRVVTSQECRIPATDSSVELSVLLARGLVLVPVTHCAPLEYAAAQGFDEHQSSAIAVLMGTGSSYQESVSLLSRLPADYLTRMAPLASYTSPAEAPAPPAGDPSPAPPPTAGRTRGK